MITKILAPVTMFLFMTVPGILLLLLQLSSTAIPASQQDEWCLKQLFQPSQTHLVEQSNGKAIICD